MNQHRATLKPQSSLLLAAALSGVLLAACSPKPESSQEVAQQQLVEATQKAEDAAARAEAAQQALEKAEAEKREAEAKASADAEQAAAAEKLKAAEERAEAAEREAAAAKRRAAAAEREAVASRPASKPAASYTEARPAPAPAPICQDCGTVSAISAVSVKGRGTGMGAVAGAVAGIAAGNQVGDGKGTDVAKVVGAIGGAFAGNEAEKRIRAETVYDVTVRMDNGTSRTVRVADASTIASGSRVRVAGSNLERI